MTSGEPSEVGHLEHLLDEKKRYAVHIYRYTLHISKKFESRSEEICTLQNLQISLRVFVQVALEPLVSDLLTF